MCGRFVLMTPGKSLAKLFGLEEEPDLGPRYNIAPTQQVAIIRRGPETLRRRLSLVRWGLVPFWAKDISIGSRLINARAESLPDKAAFRLAFKKRRCLVPSDGFYEWEKGKAGQRRPYFITSADEEPFAFAGLWESWTSPEKEVIESCTILTTDSNELVLQVHDRMPVILDAKDYDIWLDPDNQEPDLLTPLFKPFPAEKMKSRPVNPKVNKASYDAPDCIEPIFPDERA
ncbi:MAG: SOS response-associated peptidase [Desulfomonile tiedjei]|nr:SOS response-associated peptidase [Desulfomonile tiedjei]